MKKAEAVFLSVLMVIMTVSCASPGQAAGGASGGQAADTSLEAVQDQAPSASTAPEAAQEAVSAIQETASTATEAAQEAASAVQETASTVPEAAQEAASAIQETASTATEAAQEAVSAAQAAAPDQEIAVEKIEALFGEGGPLYGLLPEGTDTEVIVGAAREQMDLVNRQFSRVIEEIVEKSESGSVDFDEESLQKFAGVLLGRFIGGEEDGDADEFEFDSLDALIQAGSDIRETEKEYMKEHNSGLMENGDVQIVATDIYHEDDYEQEEIRLLCNMIQNNYRMDEENQLRFVDSAEDVVLFTHENNPEGKYPVKDAVFAEKGDNYLSSVEALFNETGEPTDTLELDLEMSRILVLYDLKEYLENHPEVKGIEYEGEIRTAEELDEIWSARLDELFGNNADTSSTQEAAEDSGTIVASAAE